MFQNWITSQFSGALWVVRRLFREESFGFKDLQVEFHRLRVFSVVGKISVQEVFE
jgi:hypothetical protein